MGDYEWMGCSQSTAVLSLEETCKLLTHLYNNLIGRSELDKLTIFQPRPRITLIRADLQIAFRSMIHFDKP